MSRIVGKVVGSMVLVVLDDEVYNRNVTSEEAKEIFGKVVELQADPENTQLRVELVKLMTPMAAKKQEELDAKKAAENQLQLEFEEEQQKDIKKEEFIKEKIDSELFDYIDGNVFLKGYKVSMPGLLVDKIIDFKEKGIDYEPLINFWKLCMLNPNGEARKDLFKYLNHHKSFIITPTGYFVTYRRVKMFQKAESKDYIPFVTEQWAKKKAQKKSPKNFTVYLSEGTYRLVDEKSFSLFGKSRDGLELGNLDELYSKISEGDVDVYTDAHSRTTRIVIGQPVRIDRKDCNEDSGVECSRGLHTGTPKFVGGGYGFGDITVGCLINPMHVVSVPKYDTHKMRSCEYYPFAILSMDEINALDQSKLEVFEHEYSTLEVEELEKMLKETNIEEYLGKYDDASDDRKQELQKKLEAIRKEITLFGDKPSEDITTEEIIKIVNSRVVSIKK
jgi:hypothetical protein